MKISHRIFAVSLLAAVASSTAANAGGSAPAQLRNKTISVVWGQSNTWRRLSDNVSGSSTVTIERTVYVSSAGRAFLRSKASSGRLDKKTDLSPDELAGRFDFNGNTVVNFMGRQGLLWRITMTFDPSFSSCSTTVNVGRDGAHPISTGIDGAQYEILSSAVSSASCSVKDGNALGE